MSMFVNRPNQGGGGGTPTTVIDNLNSNSATSALSANQGRVLDEKITAHAELKASTTVLGHVKVDGTSITVNNDGTISATGSGSTGLNFKQQVLITTEVDQTEWIIPFSDYDINNDLLIVSQNTTLLNTKMYSVSDNGVNKILTIPSDYPLPIAHNEVFLIMIKGLASGSGSNIEVVNNLTTDDPNKALSAGMGKALKDMLDTHEDVIASKTVLGHVKIDGVTLEIDSNGVLSVIGNTGGEGAINYYQGVLPTTQIGQKTWKIPLAQYNPTKDLTIVSHNTTLLSNDMYSISDATGEYIITLNDDLSGLPIDRNSLFVIIVMGASGRGTVTDIDGSIIIDGTVSMSKLSQDVQDKINNAQVDSISADKVITTPDKQFISAVKLNQIDINANSINSYGQRLTAIEDELAQGIQGDGKVKMTSNGVPVYLEDMLDGVSIVNDSGILKVITLNGMNTTPDEIDNLLQGAIGNIQAQINALNAVGNYSTSVQTHADLLALTGMQAGDMVIVISDDTKKGLLVDEFGAPRSDAPTTIYIYNGTDWVFSGFFKGGEVRDFSTDPINLNTETTGILPKVKYEKQNAQETPVASSNLVSQNVLEALDELFIYANNIKRKVASGIGSPVHYSDTAEQMYTKIINLKTLLADAITAKGIPSFNYDTLDVMADKILNIPTIKMEGVIQKKTKINANAGQQIKVDLMDAISVGDVTATLIEFIQGAQNIIHYDLEFNNGDESNFEPNNNIIFDGSMKLKSEYQVDMINNGSGKYLLNSTTYPSLSSFIPMSDDQTKFEPILKWYYTNMTSNTTPTPLVARASHEYSSSYQAWKAFNGVNLTATDSWVTPQNVGVGSWIQLFFGKEVAIDVLKIASRNDSFYRQAPTEFKLLYSNDGSQWTEGQVFTTSAWQSPNEVRTFKLNNTIKAQYFRIEVMAITETNVSIGEITFGYKREVE